MLKLTQQEFTSLAPEAFALVAAGSLLMLWGALVDYSAVRPAHQCFFLYVSRFLSPVEQVASLHALTHTHTRLHATLPRLFVHDRRLRASRPA